eukprot:gene32262-41813_t
MQQPQGIALEAEVRVAFQFIHFEAFSRKGDDKGRSVDFVLGEASRRPDASFHVERPLPPEVIFGGSIDDVRSRHDERVLAAKDIMKSGRTRAIRSSQLTLATIIASHPHEVAATLTDPKKADEVRRWEALTIGWLKAKYGEKLISVIRHTDEKHCHLHAYILPTDIMCKANLLHPGQVAKAEIMCADPMPGEDEITKNRRGDLAYRAAMRLWQDDYHQEVGLKCGLARLGPKKRRLTREEWHAERKQAAALKAAIEGADRLKAQGQRFIEKTKIQAARIEAESNVVTLQANEAVKTADKATQEALQVKIEAETAILKAKRLIGLGGLVRAFFDGFRKSAIVEKIRSDFSVDFERLKNMLNRAETALSDEIVRRRTAETREKTAIASVAQIAVERDTARAELKRLTPKPKFPDSPGYRPSV